MLKTFFQSQIREAGKTLHNDLPADKRIKLLESDLSMKTDEVNKAEIYF